MISLIRLAIPVVLSYLGMTLMGLVDLLFVGRVSPIAVGAVGLGTAAFAWAMVFGLGLLSGLDYFIPYSFGKEDRGGCRTYAIQGLWIALGISLPLMLILYLIAGQFEHWGVDLEVAREAHRFLLVLLWSMIPTLTFNVGRQYLQGLGAPKPAMWILLFANLVNVAADYYFVSASSGGPRLGAIGTAWATLASRWFSVIALFLLIAARERGVKVRFDWNGSVVRELLTIGSPAAGYMLFEVGVFAFATVLAGRLDAISLAAHQIVLSLASQAFMVPMGIGAAASVMVGQSLGRSDWVLARKWGWRALCLGLAFAVTSSAAYLIFPKTLLGIYTQDSSVLQAGVEIIFLAALFQFSDGAQVISAGALRGIGSTRSAAAANLFGHWGVGLPIGYFLCFMKGWGLAGIWVGLSVGLTAVALILVLRWHQLSVASLLVASDQKRQTEALTTASAGERK